MGKSVPFAWAVEVGARVTMLLLNAVAVANTLDTPGVAVGNGTLGSTTVAVANTLELNAVAVMYAVPLAATPVAFTDTMLEVKLKSHVAVLLERKTHEMTGSLMVGAEVGTGTSKTVVLGPGMRTLLALAAAVVALEKL